MARWLQSSWKLSRAFGVSNVAVLHRVSDLRSVGAGIDDFRYCPHHPDVGSGPYRRVCACRKPAPGMILDLIAQWPVDVAASVMVGDREGDAQAGRAAGIAAEVVPGGELERFVERFLERIGRG